MTYKFDLNSETPESLMTKYSLYRIHPLKVTVIGIFTSNLMTNTVEPLMETPTVYLTCYQIKVIYKDIHVFVGVLFLTDELV